MRIRVGRSFLAFASLWGLLGCGDASDAELSDSSSYPVRCDKNPNHSQCSNGVPAAPTTLTAAQTGTSQVTLTWVDNAVNETNYTIERKLTSASTFVQLASLGANVITYQDTTVAAGNSYDYRAKAINGVGSSGYSNTVTITLPASTARGPLASITCPVGAVPIPVGSTTASRQTLINANPNGTTFCLAAGVHTANGSNTPKTGNTFIGEFGAIIDGTGWTTSDLDEAAFRAVSLDIDNVTIRNLTIRNMPSYGVNAYFEYADNWTVDHCEVHDCRTGVSLGIGGTLSSSKIHHCVGDPGNSNPALRGGGYAINQADNVTFIDNEISYNGPEQKFLMCLAVTCSGNFYHHNFDGFWIDGEGNGSVIEDNVFEDNGRNSVVIENGVGVTVRNNLIRRGGFDNAGNGQGAGIEVTVTRNSEFYGNTVEDCYIGIDLFLDCAVLSPQFPWAQDLADNTIHHNIVKTPNVPGVQAAGFALYGTCGAPYFDNSKNNNFDHNQYTVHGGANFFYWNGSKSWSGWQGLPQDPNGTFTVN